MTEMDLVPPVNVVVIEDRTPKGRGTIRTSWATFSLSVGNPGPFLILPLNPKRIRASVIVHGLFGTGPGATSFGWVGSESDVAQANAGNSYGGCGYITPGNTQNVPIVIYGQDALWVKLDPTAAAGMTLTIAQDVQAET